MSPDGRFVAGPVPDLPGLWVASGCNGSGFSSSPAIGEALATWIATGTAPPGAEALSPARFGTLPDDALITNGLWQYAHYYDPTSFDQRLRSLKRPLSVSGPSRPARSALSITARILAAA
jgi:hypothetical protein